MRTYTTAATLLRCAFPQRISHCNYLKILFNWFKNHVPMILRFVGYVFLGKVAKAQTMGNKSQTSNYVRCFSNWTQIWHVISSKNMVTTNLSSKACIGEVVVAFDYQAPQTFLTAVILQIPAFTSNKFGVVITTINSLL